MRTLNFTLLAVFSCVAMIGATAVGSRPHAKPEVMKRHDRFPNCMECPEDPICIKCTDTPEVLKEECTGFCADNPDLPICEICPGTPYRDICQPRSE